MFKIGYPRYCTVVTLPDGSTALQGGRSRRGKPRGLPGSKDWTAALKGCDDPLFIDFLKRCLEWDPAVRMTPPQALKHAWLRRRLPKPPSENPPPSRRSSAAYRNSLVSQQQTQQATASKITAMGTNSLIGGNNILNNASNTVNATNSHKFNSVVASALNSSGGEAELNKHTKLPKIGHTTTSNMRTGS